MAKKVKISSDRQKVELDVVKIGKTIQSERKRRKFTQDELASLTGLGLNFISQIENGKETAHIGKVFQVLKVLGFEVGVKIKS